MKSKKRVPKWLKFLDGKPNNIWFSAELLKEFDRQLKPQFENYFQRPMNWERLWLFVEPIPEKYYLKFVETNEGLKITRLKAKIKCGQMSIDCIISWNSKEGNQFYHPSTSDISDDLKVLLEWINEDTTFKGKFPGLEDKPEMTRMDLDADFEVFIEGRHLTHEGNMEIIMSDISEEKIVAEVLNESLQRWNNDEEIIEGAPENRGYFHQLDFEEKQGNKLIYYLDCGSAVTGAHEYFMESLNQKTGGIEKVVFKPI